MTGTELIKIVTKKAGIPESRAKLFFELFIKRLSDIMKPGESAKFSDVGYFHLRTTQKTADRKGHEKATSEDDKINIMLFSKEVEQMDDLENNVVFTIHNIPESEHDEIDSYFSLSVGKPVFPVDGITDGELFSQKSAIEIRKTLISKAEELVSAIEKFEGVMGEEEIIIEKSPLSKRKSESLSDETPITGEDTFPSAEDIRNREFKFGKNIANQIKNEVTPEPGQEAKPKIGMDVSDSEKLPWNFGREVFDKKVEYKREDSEDIPEEKEKSIQEIESRKLSDELIETKEDEPESSSVINEEIDFRIEQEEARTAKEIEHDEKLKSVIDDFITRDEPEKFGTYERVKSSVSNFNKDKNIDKPEIEESEEEIESELAEILEETSEDGFMEVQSKSSAYHLEDKKVKTKKEEETVPTRKSSREDSYLYKSKRRNMVPFLVGFFAIVFVVAIVYLYLESDTIFKSEAVEENILPIVRPVSVKVIEREYIYPITFPYAVSDTDEEISGINLALFSDEEIVFKPPVPKQEIDKEEEETTVAVKDEKISGKESIGLVSKHVYKYKDYYVVQVASFKSYSIAEEEANKYKEMGYNTFVEIAEITDTGTWFRLRVGDFTTREKANSFANKYIK